MPRKQKGANNPLFTKRTVLKRSRSKGRGVAQKDLVGDTGEANPTEPIQVRQDQPTQKVIPQVAPKPVAYVPTMGNSALNVLPDIPSPSYSQPPSQTINFASDDYAPPQLYTNDSVPAPTSPIEIPQEPPPIPNLNSSKYSFDINSGFPKTEFSLGQTKEDKGYSYGSSSPVVQSLSEATSRFFNSLNEFFGVLGNPNKQ